MAFPGKRFFFVIINCARLLQGNLEMGIFKQHFCLNSKQKKPHIFQYPRVSTHEFIKTKIHLYATFMLTYIVGPVGTSVGI